MFQVFENIRTKISLVTLMSLAVAIASKSQAAEQPEALQLLNALPPVYQDDLIELRCDAPLANQRQLVSQLARVFDYDLRLQGLDKRPQCCKRLIIGLASKSMADRYVPTKMGGRALGERGFVSHLEGFTEATSNYSWYVAGHEFEHVLMARIGAKQPALPTYFVEGIACCVGAHYVRQSGMGSAALNLQAKTLSKISGDDVQYLFNNFTSTQDIASARQDGKLFSAEHTGGLFVEYLATRKVSSTTFFLEWAKFADDIASGSGLDESFAKHFGISLKQAQQDFRHHIESTTGNPKERFRGTVYDGYPV